MSSSRGELPEHNSATAARLLAAAGDLLLNRGAKGFTVADVATRAHVGKGTVYLYWPTKEDLLIGLIGRSFLSLLDALIDTLTADPDLARPSRFCPTMLGIATGQPLITALQQHDDDQLGALADHPRSVALHDALGPTAVLSTLIPIWRRHRLARVDWELDDQIFAMHGLIAGIALSLVRPVAAPVSPRDPLAVLSDAVTALLGPERAGLHEIRSAAEEIVEFLRAGRLTALRVIDPSRA